MISLSIFVTAFVVYLCFNTGLLLTHGSMNRKNLVTVLKHNTE